MHVGKAAAPVPHLAEVIAAAVVDAVARVVFQAESAQVAVENLPFRRADDVVVPAAVVHRDFHALRLRVAHQPVQVVHGSDDVLVFGQPPGIIDARVEHTAAEIGGGVDERAACLQLLLDDGAVVLKLEGSPTADRADSDAGFGAQRFDRRQFVEQRVRVAADVMADFDKREPVFRGGFKTVPVRVDDDAEFHGKVLPSNGFSL
ncbi:MAG: hypothetical protein BWY37_02201 [Firmicutes bacterium ADurb.Bin262]|nr:MAG: hypothetical protein BWY37_02201 [Firmicutes bacterium ADurb.Bin262]